MPKAKTKKAPKKKQPRNYALIAQNFAGVGAKYAEDLASVPGEGDLALHGTKQDMLTLRRTLIEMIQVTIQHCNAASEFMMEMVEIGVAAGIPFDGETTRENPTVVDPDESFAVGPGVFATKKKAAKKPAKKPAKKASPKKK